VGVTPLVGLPGMEMAGLFMAYRHTVFGQGESREGASS